MNLIRQQLTYREALDRARELCGRTEKCCNDIALKCLDWGLSMDEAAKLTASLVQDKFIDEHRYASSFVHDKFRFNKWGRIKLAYALRQKKIAEKNIREALSLIPENTYHQILTDLLTLKAKSIKETDPYHRRNKLLVFAQSRGFEADEIRRIIEKM